MIQVLLPILSGAIGLLRQDKTSIAKQVGTTPAVVDKIAASFEEYLSKDERIANLAAEELHKAREHDIATQVRDIPFVNLVRGLVRPLITLTAFVWYVYARVEQIPLSGEDYAIIGGILAFWFGFRPFDKRK